MASFAHYPAPPVYLTVRSTPPNPANAVAYVDTSTVPPVLKGWNGTVWVAL